MRPRFCTACGTALTLQEVEGRPRCVCPGCERVAYENPVPATAVVVRRPEPEREGGAQEVLLVRRAIEPRRGRWGLPAGYQEVDETPETTAVREVREETGLIIRLTGLIDVLATTDDPRKTSLLVVYEGEEVAGELEPGSDCDEVAWFGLDQLPSELAFRNDRIILGRLARGEPRRW